jgi:ectoine hydroxylase-related dioxygenase (phytanoyl-CoA dioxygenase family)
MVMVVMDEQVLPHHLERNRKGKASHSGQEQGDQSSWYLFVNEADLPEGERVDIEMKMGSVVFFNNRIPHCSGDNTYTSLTLCVTPSSC